MGNLDLSTDTKVQFRQCFTEDHDEPSGDEDDMLTHGVAGSDADDEDSRAGHVRFSEDYVEVESDEEDEPRPLMTSPHPTCHCGWPGRQRWRPHRSAAWKASQLRGMEEKETRAWESKTNCELCRR